MSVQFSWGPGHAIIPIFPVGPPFQRHGERLKGEGPRNSDYFIFKTASFNDRLKVKFYLIKTTLIPFHCPCFKRHLLKCSWKDYHSLPDSHSCLFEWPLFHIWNELVFYYVLVIIFLNVVLNLACFLNLVRKRYCCNYNVLLLESNPQIRCHH